MKLDVANVRNLLMREKVSLDSLYKVKARRQNFKSPWEKGVLQSTLALKMYEIRPATGQIQLSSEKIRLFLKTFVIFETPFDYQVKWRSR